MKQRRIWVVLGLGAALSLAPVATTAVQAADRTGKPTILEVRVNVWTGDRDAQADVEVQAAHIPRLPE